MKSIKYNLNKLRVYLFNASFHYGFNYIVTYIPWMRFRTFFCIIFGCKIHRTAHFAMGVRLFETNLVIEENSVINRFAYLDTRGGIYIGRNVSVGPFVKVSTADHDMRDGFNYRTGKVVIEDYSFVGINAVILGPLTMGQGSVLAAGAVAKSDLKKWSIFAGVPAKFIGERQRCEYSTRWKMPFN